MDYKQHAIEDARDTARNYLDEIHEFIIDDGEASDDLLNDYGNGDAYHHESHTDKAYSLSEAADCLEQLDDFEETDSGLWEGLKPREAISCQAAYTYGNAVYSFWRDLIKAINEDDDLLELKEQYDNMETVVQDEYDDAKNVHEENEQANEDAHNQAQDGLPEEDQTDYDPEEFTEPFDVTEETEKRQDALKPVIKTRIEEIIDSFDA